MALVSDFELAYEHVYSDGVSRRFPARYGGPCASCGGYIYQNEPAQFVNHQFGHPISIVKNISVYRSCQVTENYGQVLYKKEVESVAVNDEIRRAEQHLDALYAKRAAIQKFGTDAEYPDGAVLLFRHTGTYWRAVVKTSANCWHVTGSGNPSFRFDDLVERHLVGASEVWFGTDYEKV